MSTDRRWMDVKNLYAAALSLDEDQRKRYLDQNCGDPKLREEVERLLLSDATMTDVEVVAGPGPKGGADILPPGTILGHYRIQKRLGAGGMGLVYEALDQKLERSVAVKIIKLDAAGQEDRTRFLREAQAVSALNHPNIVTVYEAGSHEGLDFIAMERVHGQTLRQKIGSKGLDPRTALRYAVQMADALAAAHEAGIVHRDLKPGNVMVTDRDVVKVLDFGLAKRQTKPGGLDESLTGEGRIVGTAAYMSPEQAQSRAVDGRSDIFSFGSVLYEMLTGVRAFQEDSFIGTMAAILNKEPPPLHDVPGSLARVIGKCLQKKPHDRWQDMQDLKLVLAGLLEDLETVGSAVLPPAVAGVRKRRWLAPAAIVAGGLATGALLMYGWVMRTRPEATDNEPVYRMVTADNGLNDYPALSRDGKFLAFASDRAGGDNLDIWLQQMGGREMIQLTKDPADETDPSFSPDGTHIAYRSEKDGGGIYIVQTLGGEPTLLVREGRNPRYSPDGQSIAYWTERGGGSFVPGSSKVFVIHASGGQPRQIQPLMAGAQFPVWSPKGDSILVYGMNEASDAGPEFWVLPTGGSKPVKTGINQQFQTVKFPRGNQMPGRDHQGALEWSVRGVITPFAIADSVNLWETALDANLRIAGLPRRLTSGPGRQVHGSLASTETVEHLLFSDVSVNYDILSAPLDAAVVATRITDSIATEWAPSIAANGRDLVFIGQRSGSWAVLLRDLETRREKVLVSTPVMPVGAAISGDGKRVAYSDSDYNMHSMSAQGGEVERVKDQRGTIRALSNDGRYATFEPVKDEDAVMYDLAQKQLITLARRQHPNDVLSGTHLSPDGKWAAFHADNTSTRRTRIWIVPVDASQPAPPEQWIAITGDDIFAQDPCWSPDGGTIYFSSERDGFRCFWGQRVEPATRKPAGTAFPVRHFHSARQTLRGTGGTGQLTGISAASGRLFYSIGESKGNIWLEEKRLGR